MASKPYRDEDWLRERWFDEDKRVYEIADEANCTEGTIQTWRKKFDFPQKDDVYAEKYGEQIEKWYCDDLDTLEEIAERLDASVSRIQRTLEKRGVERRSRSLAYAINGYHGGFEMNADGYLTVTANYNGERQRCYMHRLLAVAKYGFGAVKGKDVHHKNGLRWDNRPDNIELIDKQEHGRMHGEEGGRPPGT